MDTTFSWLDSWRLSPLALSMLLPLCDPPAEARGLTDPAMIDRAVAEFTGAGIGALIEDPEANAKRRACEHEHARQLATAQDADGAHGWRGSGLSSTASV